MEVKSPWLRVGTIDCPHTATERIQPLAWVLYPEEPPPEPTSKSVVVAVHEMWCASRRNPLPYLKRPEVRYLRRAVVITLWIEIPQGPQLCPSNPTKRLEVKLPGPLGTRQLYDGSADPPRPVKPGEDPRGLPAR
jgi:hypothetical protein